MGPLARHLVPPAALPLPPPPLLVRRSAAGGFSRPSAARSPAATRPWSCLTTRWWCLHAHGLVGTDLRWYLLGVTVVLPWLLDTPSVAAAPGALQLVGSTCLCPPRGTALALLAAAAEVPLLCRALQGARGVAGGAGDAVLPKGEWALAHAPCTSHCSRPGSALPAFAGPAGSWRAC